MFCLQNKSSVINFGLIIDIRAARTTIDHKDLLKSALLKICNCSFMNIWFHDFSQTKNLLSDFNCSNHRFMLFFFVLRFPYSKISGPARKLPSYSLTRLVNLFGYLQFTLNSLKLTCHIWSYAHICKYKFLSKLSVT